MHVFVLSRGKGSIMLSSGCIFFPGLLFCSIPSFTFLLFCAVIQSVIHIPCSQVFCSIPCSQCPVPFFPLRSILCVPFHVLFFSHSACRSTPGRPLCRAQANRGPGDASVYADSKSQCLCQNPQTLYAISSLSHLCSK